ncbi:hypothetical protein [Streptomyces demainii]|uniref:Antitoxin n=1 Tax=Streptomyces demainii TaxID=588122 RepID=A0ABT9L725_9ACTN|nr:hypothetical protein [Streptomyces demainii]MDP9616497.1 hypothetical protein [Streptomyces demainii]
MPSLNIDYTEEELAAIRAEARGAGQSLRQYVHDASLRDRQRTEFVNRALTWGDEHRAEFDEAFPDEVPPAQRSIGAEAA